MTCDKYENGYEVNHTIEKYTGDCVYTERQLASFYMGMLSIFIWMIALMPQLWLTFRSKKPESVSLPFLIVWVLGDLTGLIGAILTKQLATQIYLAWYFLIVCVLLTLQNMYYTRRQKKILSKNKPAIQNLEGGDGEIVVSPGPQEEVIPKDVTAESVESTTRPGPSSSSATLASLSCVLMIGALTLMTSEHANYGLRRSLLEDDELDRNHWRYWFGVVCAYLCAVFYVGSRIPQIMLNFKRKATDGLSLKMFIMGVLGNTTYVASILIYSTNKQFLLDRLPFLLNSAPTLVLDALILFQSMYYKKTSEVSADSIDGVGEGEKPKTLSAEEDFDGEVIVEDHV